MRKLYVGVIAIFTLLGTSGMVLAKGANKINPADADLIEQIIHSIPSPIEMTMLMKESGVTYDRDMLNDYNNSDKYTTNYKKALNLGIYSTNLGFSNIYGKTQDAIHYLDAVQDLAEGLAIDQFFEYSTLKALAEKENLGELIQSTTRNFEKINNHLHEQNRDVISALLLTGGWIESTHLTTLIYSKSAGRADIQTVLKEKIAEQKFVLERLMLLLDIYSSKPQVPELLNSMEKLQDIYDDVEISTTGDVKMRVIKHDDGTIEFVNDEVSTAKISSAQISEITTILSDIRKSIIQ
ncbi:MAG: hypothetical protein ACI85I_000742 [Arenicella sp.]|jgi:uncharacterized protein YjgD (DUF1641 family)